MTLPKEVQAMIPPLNVPALETHNTILQMSNTYGRILASAIDERNTHIVTWRTIAEQQKVQVKELQGELESSKKTIEGLIATSEAKAKYLDDVQRENFVLEDDRWLLLWEVRKLLDTLSVTGKDLLLSRRTKHLLESVKKPQGHDERALEHEKESTETPL